LKYHNLASSLITLTTDFGLTDTYVGVMKGVILGIAPRAQIVDLTHAIAPQNILEASARLEAAIDFFPSHTLHLVVVDPGVGSRRDAVVVPTDKGVFIAPDNGVLTLPLRRCLARTAVRLGDQASPYLRQPVSATFHGRDIFAPIAAHLAAGVLPESLGDRCDPRTLVLLSVPTPYEERSEEGRPVLHVPILYCDHFGNLITALTPAEWSAWHARLGIDAEEAAAKAVIQAGSGRWKGIRRTFRDVEADAPLAYWGSAGRLEIAIREGNAAQTLALTSRAAIYLTF
jgi:S-adenosylmethionine hydrolase